MKKSSWIILSLCIVLAGSLVTIWRLSQMGGGTLTEAQARSMIQTMQDAVAHKNVNAIMSYIAPEGENKIVNLQPDQLRALLARAFYNAQGLSADVSHFTFAGGAGEEATAQFDLVLSHDEGGMKSEMYTGQITLHLHRVDVPHLFGLYSTHDWRIVAAETTGPNPKEFGDL